MRKRFDLELRFDTKPSIFSSAVTEATTVTLKKSANDLVRSILRRSNQGNTTCGGNSYTCCPNKSFKQSCASRVFRPTRLRFRRAKNDGRKNMSTSALNYTVRNLAGHGLDKFRPVEWLRQIGVEALPSPCIHPSRAFVYPSRSNRKLRVSRPRHPFRHCLRNQPSRRLPSKTNPPKAGYLLNLRQPECFSHPGRGLSTNAKRSLA